ncbi:DExH-box ATP-dependent RNA helicase DExH14 [Linum grandiflorum]
MHTINGADHSWKTTMKTVIKKAAKIFNSWCSSPLAAGEDSQFRWDRVRVKLKKEIVSLGMPTVSPIERVGKYVKPRANELLISDPDTFKGAVDPCTSAFRDFPSWVDGNFELTEADNGNQLSDHELDTWSSNGGKKPPRVAAEVTSTFGRRLAPLNMIVRELTGDMQLSKNELEETQMIVTTPEKWDVITRKSSDISLSMLVKLLIIDEVHLLNDDRGPVIEALGARTLRQVAQFLRVNPEAGLFFFDSSYRPVPLAQQYIGISEQNFAARNELLNEVCYKKVVDSLKQGHQAMVFVHSRKDTAKQVELAMKYEDTELFCNDNHPQFGLVKKAVSKSRNKDLVQLFESAVGVHHVGMLRSDRGLTERLFSDGLLKVYHTEGGILKYLEEKKIKIERELDKDSSKLGALSVVQIKVDDPLPGKMSIRRVKLQVFS